RHHDRELRLRYIHSGVVADRDRLLRPADPPCHGLEEQLGPVGHVYAVVDVGLAALRHPGLAGATVRDTGGPHLGGTVDRCQQPEVAGLDRTRLGDDGSDPRKVARQQLGEGRDRQPPYRLALPYADPYRPIADLVPHQLNHLRAPPPWRRRHRRLGLTGSGTGDAVRLTPANDAEKFATRAAPCGRMNPEPRPGRHAMAYTTAFPILHSDDPKRLMEFYTTVMGLPVTYRFPAEGDPEFITVGVGAATIGIGDYTTVDRMLGRVARGGHPFQLCVYTDDLDGDLERLRAAGAKVHMEPADQPWGERMGYVADPDGNLLMLAQKLPRRPQPEEPSAGE